MTIHSFFLLILTALIGVSLEAPAQSELGRTSRHTESQAVSRSLPECHKDSAEIAKIKQVQEANRTNQHKYKGYEDILSTKSDEELLARLAYAETLAANCPKHQERILPLVAEVIANRIRIRKGNVRSVVFQRDQFASSFNFYEKSRYRDFLCPNVPHLWAAALEAARTQLQGKIQQLPKDTVNYYFFLHHTDFPVPTWAKAAEVPLKDGAELGKCVRFFEGRFK